MIWDGKIRIGQGSTRSAKRENMAQEAARLIMAKPGVRIGYVARYQSNADGWVKRVSELVGRDCSANIQVVISEQADY